MKKIITGILFIFICSGVLFSAGRYETDIPPQESLTVFNAASTTDMITDLGRIFFEKTGIEIRSNPASSGTLAKQLEQGADADLYISASKKWMKYVQDLGLPAQSSSFVRNSLVLIAPASADRETVEISEDTDLPSLFSGRISIGDPAHVPAGAYAAEALEYYGWLDDLEDRIQPAADVRGALLVVEMGEAELGIVYKTDALKSGGVSVVGEFPAESHKQIEYFCAVLENAPPAAAEFYEFLLTGDEAAAVYRKYGFSGFE